MGYLNLIKKNLAEQRFLRAIISISFLLPLTTAAQTAAKPVAVLYDLAMLQHDTGAGHPERPERLSTVVDYLKQQPINAKLQWPKVKPASDETIQLVHSKAYLEKVKREVASIKPNETKNLSTGDTVLSANTLTAARYAVGAAVQGVDMIMQGKAQSGFALVRPPGHHASRNTGMGFCVFNNVAIAAKHLQKKYGLKRILIVDFDVHHGNGTQAIFEADPSVYYFSVHQSPLYPGTGEVEEIGVGQGEGYTMNVPLSPGSGDSSMIKALKSKLLPAMQNFNPEFIIVSAGIDSHQGDLLGGLTYSSKGYGLITSQLIQIPSEHSQSRLLFVLEGGYKLSNLRGAIENILQALQKNKPVR